MIHDLNDYIIEICKDNRIRAYSKITHKVVSYPRLLMENYLNRKLLKIEDVHHKDGNPLNNNIDNLEVLDHREHDRMHSRKNDKYFDKTMTCPICGKIFLWTRKQQITFNGNRKDNNRITENQAGPFCSRKCRGIYGQRQQAAFGRANKYTDKIVICRGCGKEFLYTAKMQRERKAKTRDNPFCSIECVYKTNIKYNIEIAKEFQKYLMLNNGSFAKVGKLLNIRPKAIINTLKRFGMPYHTNDYKTSAC